MPPSVHLLYDHSIDESRIDELVARIEALEGTLPQKHLFKKRRTRFESGARIYAMVPDEGFAPWLHRIAGHDVTVAILPYEGNPLQRKVYAVPKEMEEALALAADEESRRSRDLFLCCGEPTLEKALVGEEEWSGSVGVTEILRRLFSLHLRPMELATEKGQEVRTAALVVEGGMEAVMTKERPYYFKSGDDHCSRVAAVVYAPQSVLGVLKLRFFLAKRRKSAGDSLPEGIGTFKTRRLKIASADGSPLHLRIGPQKRQAEEVVLESVPMEAAVVTGWKECQSGEEKESVRVQNLPADSDLIAFFSKKSLPLIPIAAESTFAELFTKLRENARMDNAYLLLLLVSVLMATTGLFQDSSPTIIGAMILAPLMAPIVAFSMGVVRFDDTLLTRSGRTILLSTLIALGASALMAWALPFAQLTDQMSLRTHPTLLDLAVAIFSGVAAAYGYINSKVGESLAGVAIAVALVPPLCVSGIGIGWGSWHIFSNALLLYFTNIVGIMAAAGTTFYLMGYASKKYVSAAFFLKLALVAVVAVPLWLSTESVVEEQRVYKELSTYQNLTIDGKRVQVHLMEVHHREDGMHVHLTVTSDGPLNEMERSKIAQILRKKLGRKSRIIMVYRERF